MQRSEEIMKQVQSAEQKLNAYLREGETVRWTGKTEEFAMLEKDAKCRILGKWIGTVIVVAAFIALYIGNNENWTIPTVAVVLVIGILLLVSPVIERNSLLKQRYWITDQRVILMSADQYFSSLEVEQLDEFRVENDATVNPTLVVGACLFEEGNRQLRWRGCHPKTASQSASAGRDVVEGLVLFSVTDGKEAAKYLGELCLKHANA